MTDELNSIFGASDAPLAKCISFALELDRLKIVERAIRPKPLSRYENPAEHSWQAALLGLMMARLIDPLLDAARVAELLLVHDLGEIDAGDQLAFLPASEQRASQEEAGVRRIAALLPQESGHKLYELWSEFEQAKSAEAGLANAIDRLMPVVQNLSNGGQSWRENHISRARVEAKIRLPIASAAPALWELVERALDEAERRGFFGA